MHTYFAGGGRRWHGARAQRTAFGLAGLVTLAAAIVASGCHDRHRGGWRAEHGSASRRIDRALDWLDVEGEARERARVAALRLAGEAEGMRADAIRLADEALAQWGRTAPDAGALHRVLDEQLDALRTRAHRVVDDALELHATLDEEQRAEVADALGSRPGARHGHRRW
jgi:hypothetical protein